MAERRDPVVADELLSLAGELTALEASARRLGADGLGDALHVAAFLARLGDDRAIARLGALFSASAIVLRRSAHPEGGLGVLFETSRVFMHAIGQMTLRSLPTLSMDELLGALGRAAVERDRLEGEVARLRTELAAERHARGLAERAASAAGDARAPTPRPPSSRSPVPGSVAPTTMPCPRA